MQTFAQGEIMNVTACMASVVWTHANEKFRIVLLGREDDMDRKVFKLERAGDKDSMGVIPWCIIEEGDVIFDMLVSALGFMSYENKK